MKLITLAVIVVLVGGGTATWLILKHQHDQDLAHQQALRQAATAREATAAAAARTARQQAAEAAAREQRALRHGIVRDLQKAITKDARKDEANGVLTGPPIIRTSCQPVGGGNADNLAAHTGNYSCIAVNKISADGTEAGFRFSGIVNYDAGSYTWHIGG